MKDLYWITEDWAVKNTKFNRILSKSIKYVGWTIVTIIAFGLSLAFAFSLIKF